MLSYISLKVYTNFGTLPQRPDFGSLLYLHYTGINAHVK